MKRQHFLMSAVTTACLLGAQLSAQAAGVDPTNIPLNSQIGSLRIPLSCTFPIIGKQTLNIKLTGSMATTVTPGQQFYMTDGSGILELPQGLVDLSYNLLGARFGNGTISELNFAIANGTPAIINGVSAPIVVENLPIVAGQPVRMALPPTGFIQIGPLTATSTVPSQVLVKMSSAKGVLRLLTKTGKTILWDLGVACAAPSPEIIVLGMTVAGTHSDEVSAPHTNIRTEDLDAPFMTQAGSLRFPLSCNISGLGRREVDGTFTGIAPALYAPGEVFDSATSGYGNIVLSGDTIGEMLAQVPTAKSAALMVTRLEFNSTNTAPAQIDMAATGAITGADIPLVAGQRAASRIPASGFLTIGKWKALTTGTDTAMYVGRTNATVALKNGNGQVIDTRTVACDEPNPRTTLVSVTIGGKAVVPSAVTGLAPTSGTTAGGKTVYITGSNFTNARNVYFGTLPAPSFSVVSSGLITAVTPASSTGVVDVKVQGVGGSSTAKSYTFK